LAYLDLAFGVPRAAIAAGNACNVTPQHDAFARLALLEQQVIVLARYDHASSLRNPGRIDAALSWLFGWKSASKLADPRLEALRRYAVTFRLQGEELPQEESDRLIDAGYAASALNEIRRMIRCTITA
jgi:hypothetical protein